MEVWQIINMLADKVWQTEKCFLDVTIMDGRVEIQLMPIAVDMNEYDDEDDEDDYNEFDV